ncbi:MAG: hypothetical protein WAR78_06780 [Ferruginibacter sp.]
MRIFVFIILALSIYSPILAQIEAKTIDFNNKLEINLQKEIFTQSFSNSIHSVNVIDVRDDTMAVGYHYLKEWDAKRYLIQPGTLPKNKNNDAWSKVYHCSSTLSIGFTEWINEYLQCRKDESVKTKLLIVVKKFWLTSEADKIRFDNDKTGQAINGWDAGVLCKLELYLEKDSVFFPLYRIDSVFTFKEKLNDYAGIRFVDNADFFVTSALKASLKKLVGIIPDEIIVKRKRLSFEDISREYSKKMDIPVLKFNDLQKGVYKDFEEFKANAPSIQDYELRNGTIGDIIYIKEGGSEYPTRNAWGFCDGTDIFINSGDKYSKLVRRENTFYFLGIKGVKQGSKHIAMMSSGLNYAMNTGPKKTVYKLDLKYYQIDMETGEVY